MQIGIIAFRYKLILLLIFFISSPVSVEARHGELPNRIPEEAPYNLEEAKINQPPYEVHWTTGNSPTVCAGCHQKIFKGWNGSMMANSWRDPVWRAAFLLISRLTATDGNCGTPEPPDGTPRAKVNPYANEDCTSTFDLGTEKYTTKGSGSLLDDFCSRCHMPTNYIDQIAFDDVKKDKNTGREHGLVNSNFNPTSDDGTGVAFATLDKQFRNTQSGKLGISCAVCHLQVDSRNTPYHGYPKSGKEYKPSVGRTPRETLHPEKDQDHISYPAQGVTNLGYAIGSGSYKISPHALVATERFGPLTRTDKMNQKNEYISEVFGRELSYPQGKFTIHKGYYQVKFERGEACGACHDVTNPLTLKNHLGRWVGGFPIERTYSEWANSRYADRPGNRNYNPVFKRDCQTCHMQQDYGKPGTGLTLYREGKPIAPITGSLLPGGPERTVLYTHHFIGGNAFIPNLIGETVSGVETAEYPKLSIHSFSSASSKSKYSNAYWLTDQKGKKSQHSRLAWDRLSNTLTLSIDGPAVVKPGDRAPLKIKIVNEGAGHKFPSGFPEGRIAWLAVRATDLSTGEELPIYDAKWNRTSLGVGYLTNKDMVDPNFPDCNWILPAGSPDPYAYLFRAVASLGDGCPTLALSGATPLNLVVNTDGMPIDRNDQAIDRNNPLGLPQYKDMDGDGDFYDDSFLADTRLRPLPHQEAALDLDRYEVLIPDNITGPVAVSATVYYQSVEAMVSLKFLGNLADTDLDFKLEPGVLKSLNDGRISSSEPAVVEGPPPIPMVVRNRIIKIAGQKDDSPPRFLTYPFKGAKDVYQDVVIKAFFSEPITGIDMSRFSLKDSRNNLISSFVRQIGPGTWALFPHRVFLERNKTYTASLAGPICDYTGNCIDESITWNFTITATEGGGSGDTRIPLGFELTSKSD